ncbi:hypothetical protein BJF85_07760 [Saccharomonospora sp. CUA-673]|uniref:hypothetical protein n=1 Tax=Saccharomonospora sp. CUA-673 TaxID=1904969 RepID=UPI000961DD2B|nr:hypothetical protein [Saccharomonospora sp. CUA-673]OLT39093.1 hypothetical protein BJF85_07760 [Saccharomonospora sp. CUA-673]
MDRSETADRLAREVRRQVHAAVLRQQNEILERRHAAPVEPRASIPSAEPRDAEPRDAEPRAGESRDAESGDAAPRDIEVGEVEPHDTVARGVDATERTDITEDREVERDEEIDVEIGD